MSQADVNGDGNLSRAEADNVSNLIMGGFFFAADANADGIISPEEGRSARSQFLERVPVLASLFEQARKATGKSPFATLAKLLDVEYGKPLSNQEAHTAAKNAVAELFESVDRNRDASLTPEEIQTAELEVLRTVGQTVFARADANSDRQLSLAEFKTALAPPTERAFQMFDGDADGRLSEAEATRALGNAARWTGSSWETLTQPSAVKPAPATPASARP